MSEPIEWIYQAGTGCAYCKDGLCQRMNQLMENGHSQRSAARAMEDECEGKWTAQTIENNFRNWTAPNLVQNPKPQPTPEEVFRKKYNAFLEEVKKAQSAGWETVPYFVACDLIGDLNNYV
jgi:hypothetical protein